MGAKIGERRILTLAPEDVYGQPIDEAILMFLEHNLQ